MSYRILILGASYGSLLGTKCLMAGHNVTLVCRDKTAQLINAEGTEVRLKLKGEDAHRSILSGDLPGQVDAKTPSQVNVSDYDLVGLAMQEPQYATPEIKALLAQIADAKLPCLSIMNMPPLAYLRRMEAVDASQIESAFTDPRAWDGFEPGTMSLCSPDPQAFRPPEEAANVLHVGLPTNFKAAKFELDAHNAMLETLAEDIAAVRLDGKDVPVKLRVHDSLFVPLAKWSMLLTGNYRCITRGEPIAIRDAVHGDLEASRAVYSFVDDIAKALGADEADLVPFEKYAKAAESLLKPSSAARAVAAGASAIERVDRIVQMIARSLDMTNDTVDETVEIVDEMVAANAVGNAA